jgi:hypothetical protein
MLVEEKVGNHKKDNAGKEKKLDNISPCHTVYEDRLSLIQGNSRRFSHICTRNLILIYDLALKFFLTFFFFFKVRCSSGEISAKNRSRIHERTISLRFLSIILRVLRLEVSIYNALLQTNQFQNPFARGGGGW